MTWRDLGEIATVVLLLVMLLHDAWQHHKTRQHPRSPNGPIR